MLTYSGLFLLLKLLTAPTGLLAVTDYNVAPARPTDRLIGRPPTLESSPK